MIQQDTPRADLTGKVFGGLRILRLRRSFRQVEMVDPVPCRIQLPADPIGQGAAEEGGGDPDPAQFIGHGRASHHMAKADLGIAIRPDQKRPRHVRP